MTLLAAVGAQAFEIVAAGAPAGVDVRPLGDGAIGRAAFVVPGSRDRAVFPEIAAAGSVRVVQVLSAGTDWIEPHVPPRAVLCNARGARDIPVAEWIAGAILGAATGLLRAARERRWERVPGTEVAGSTVLVLGAGSIGAAVRARLEPFGARVIGVARRARAGVHAAEELPALLPAADVLVVLLPLTDATRGSIDAATLALLPDGALVVNAGRGAVLDTAALHAEVAAGRLRAVLDVTDPEPLPAGHALWREPGTLAITAHHAGDSAAAERRAGELALTQLERFARGEPLRNVVPGVGAG